MVCAKCGADAVIPRAILMDQGQGSGGVLSVKVERHPEALFFKDASQSPLKKRRGETMRYKRSLRQALRAFLRSWFGAGLTDLRVVPVVERPRELPWSVGERPGDW